MVGIIPLSAKFFSGTFYRYIPLTWDMEDPKIPYNTYLNISSPSLEIAQIEH